jgi:hypothetical protein
VLQVEQNNIKAMFVFVERIQKPDIQADSNEQRFFSTKLIFLQIYLVWPMQQKSI